MTPAQLLYLAEIHGKINSEEGLQSKTKSTNRFSSEDPNSIQAFQDLSKMRVPRA